MSAAHPPLTQVAAALRTTTERLARELASPTHEAPPWSEFEWRIARAATAMHGVSSLLDAALRWQGPQGWRRFLREQRQQTVGRHLQIESLLADIDAHARREGVALVALKGAALHAAGLYAGGERPMGDIDLLVREDDTQAAARVIERCGYAAGFTTHRHRVFQPRVKKTVVGDRLGESTDDPLKIELHTRIAEHLPVTPTDITEYLFPDAAHPGLNAYPGHAFLMMHLLLHAAGNMRARALRLIQLHDIARLAPRLGPAGWEELLAARASHRSSWWALAPLMLTARYYPQAIPPGLFADLRAECPWLLARRARRQQLADVSWSNIHIEAFPGLEWSRTPREALKFMRSRIWPSREARLELKEGAAQIPGSATVPWYGISHGARILRWVFSRPPRVQTMLSVHAALAQEPAMLIDLP
jgi:hypothetical protein